MDQTLYSVSTEEIPTLIEKASVFGGRLAQPSAGLNTATVIERIDMDRRGLLYLKLRDNVELESKRPVIIRLNYRNISFSLSSRDYSLYGNTVIGHLPKEAKAIAIRDTERYVIPLNNIVKGSLQRVEKRGGTLESELKVVDVSSKGLGLIIPTFDPGDFVAYDHIWLKKLSFTEFKQPIFGRIVYSYERKFKNASELKCGIALDSELPEELFLELKQKCRLVLKA